MTTFTIGLRTCGGPGPILTDSLVMEARPTFLFSDSISVKPSLKRAQKKISQKKAAPGQK